MKKTLAWLLAAAFLCVSLAGCAEKEEPAPLEETVNGSLLDFDGVSLRLDGDAIFTLDEGTSVSLARGFVLGDSFTVTYPAGSDRVLSLRSERAEDKEFALRGTVTSVDHLSVCIDGEDGKSYRFPLSTAVLDLWQGLQMGMYVEASGLGIPAESESCLWLQSLRDNDGSALLSAEEEPEATAPAAEAPVVEAEAPVMDGEELPWELIPTEDEVWVTATANLRAGPGMDYARLGPVPGGETLERRGIAGDWSLVKMGAMEGYVMNALLLTAVPEQSFVIHYEAQGGEGVPEDQYKALGLELLLSRVVPSRPGYHFEGWNTHEEGYGIRLEAGDVFQMDEDTILYAQWGEGEAAPVPEPTAPPETVESEAPAEPTPTPEPAPILDSCRPLKGVIDDIDGETLVLDAGGESYAFDIARASVLAERGLHPGDGVTVWYAGEIGPEADCSRAPAVCLEVTAGAAELEGTVAGLWAKGLALDVKESLVFVAVSGEGFAIGDRVTVTLKAESAGGNLLAATDIR